MIRLLFIITAVLSSLILHSQSNFFIAKLPSLINPDKDSIKTLKLKEECTYKIKNGKKEVDYKISYDEQGRIIYRGRSNSYYKFVYGSNDQLIFMTFPDPESRVSEYLDSMAVSSSTDSAKVLRILYMFNERFYKIFGVYLNELRKGEKTTDDIQKVCNFEIKTRPGYDGGCYIRSIKAPHNSHYPYHEKDTFIYDFGYHPANITMIRCDSLKHSRKEYYYYPTYPGEIADVFDGYELQWTYENITHQDYEEEIYEHYTDNLEKTYKDIQSKEVRKYYKDRIEFYEYGKK